jgi:thioredoxin 1
METELKSELKKEGDRQMKLPDNMRIINITSGFRTAVLMLAGLLLLSGCGGSDQAASETANGEGASAAEAVDKEAAEAADNPIDRARASGKPAFVSFGADTCIPCQTMKPFREAVAEKYGERLNVVYVHVNEEPELSSRYGVRFIPHVIFFDADGREVHAESGLMSQEQIEEWVQKIGVADA